MTDSEMKRLQYHKAVGPDVEHFLSQGSLTKPRLTQFKSPALLNQPDLNSSLFFPPVCVAYWEQDQNAKAAAQLLCPWSPPPPRDSEVSLHMKCTLKEKDCARG